MWSIFSETALKADMKHAWRFAWMAANCWATVFAVDLDWSNSDSMR